MTDETSIKYKGMTFTPEGIQTTSGLLLWQNISAISYRSNSVIGIGGTTITYAIDQGSEEIINLKASSASGYRDAMAIVIDHVEHAPEALREVLERSPLEKYAEMLSVLQLLGGLLISCVMLALLMAYVPIRAHLFLTFTILTLSFLVPESLAMFALIKKIPAAATLVLSSIVTIMPLIVGVSLFFALSYPMHWMIGDITKSRGNIDIAEVHYAKALDRIKGNTDLHLELGIIALDKEDWDSTYTHLSAIYNSSAGSRSHELMKYIPIALLNMKQYQESITWAKRITDENKDNKMLGLSMLQVRGRARAMSSETPAHTP
jgi:hypothetical protein